MWKIMGLENILKKIEEETAAKIYEVDSSIEGKVEEIMRGGDEKAARLREDLLREAGARIEAERGSKLAMARLDFRKDLLQGKRLLLDEIFEAAFNDIRNSDYKEFIKKLILLVAERDGKVFVSNKDKGTVIGDLGDGYYKIKNVNSGKYLEVMSALTDDGADIGQWEDTGHECQEWSLESVDGYYILVNRNSSKAADVYEWSTDDGAEVVQWSNLSGENQQWNIVAY